MKVDYLIKEISDIESELKKISKSHVISQTDGIVLGTMGAFLVLSIAEFPRWISFAGLVAIAGKCFHIFNKWKSADNELKIVRKTIAKNLLNLRNICSELEKAPEIKTNISGANEDVLPTNISSIILPLQRLENTSTVFGDKFHGIVREEIDRVLRKYKLEFIEYSNDTKDCYDTEEADIDDISYASVAVVKKNRSIDSRESPIILKGKVFIPKNKD